MEKRELYHYGVKGMKWGVRKAQVKSAGKKLSKKLRLAGRVISKKAKQTASDISSKRKAKREEEAKRERERYLTTTNVKKLTSDELVERAKILSLRKQALDVEKSCKQINSELVDSGKSFVKKFASEAVGAAVISAGQSVLGDYFVKLGKNALGLKDAEDPLSRLKKEAEIWKLKGQVAEGKTKDKNWRNSNKGDNSSDDAKPKASTKGNSKSDSDPKTNKSEGDESKNRASDADKKNNDTNETSSSKSSRNSNNAETYSGTVEGEGTSRRNTTRSTGPTVDGEWRDVVNSMSTAIVPTRTSPNVNSGRSYINNQDLSNYYLEDPDDK